MDVSCECLRRCVASCACVKLNHGAIRSFKVYACVMMNKCAVGCKSGYSKTDQQSDVKVTFHALPLTNKEVCDKWMQMQGNILCRQSIRKYVLIKRGSQRHSA